MSVMAVTAAEFDRVVLKSSVPVLVAFTGEGASNPIPGLLEEAAGLLGDKASVVTCDLDSIGSLTEAKFPALVFYVHGEIEHTIPLNSTIIKVAPLLGSLAGVTGPN